MDISFLCSGIRTENWATCFGFVFRDASMSVEVICVGPRSLPPELENDSRIKFIYDEGSPVRGFQLAAAAASGSRVMPLTDDSMMEPNALNSLWGIIRDQDRKTVVLGKYTEGGRKNWKIQLADNYYKVHGSAYTASKYVPIDWLIANFAFIDRSYFKEIGGWDCQFESLALALTDFAIRAQRDGSKFILSDIKMFSLSFDTTEAGHGSIYDAFMQNDLPLYRSIYDDPKCVNRIKIDFDNWKESPKVWERRR